MSLIKEREITKGKKVIAIGIGEYYSSSSPVVIKTLLGSCVAVCLFDKEKKIGGMNHILLPGDPAINKNEASSQYGIYAMELLINSMMKLGGEKKNFIAKVFGGGYIVSSLSYENSPGLKNIKFVEDFLYLEKIPIVSKNTGGIFSRVVYFHSDTAEVYVRKIESSFNSKIEKTEKNYLLKIEEEIKKPPDITFF